MTNVQTASLFDLIRVGATVTGFTGPDPVKIVAVERLTDDSANVAYRTESGIGEKIRENLKTLGFGGDDWSTD